MKFDDKDYLRLESRIYMKLALNISMVGVNGKEILYVLKTLHVVWNSFRLICSRQKASSLLLWRTQGQAGKERRKRPES